MRAKVIKTAEDHEAALARIGELMDSGSTQPEDLDELELLAVLVERYEDDKFPIGLPSPVEAIRFRMEQQGLSQGDLVKYIGSKSKVSEVLSGKRPLSLKMMRRLSRELGIPAEVLLRVPDALLSIGSGIDWKRFPLAEMWKRGWFEGFKGSLQEAKQLAEELVSDFAKEVGHELLSPIYCRTGVSDGRKMDGYALAAWRVQVCKKALKETLPHYTAGTVTRVFADTLTKLSFLDDGPALAKEFLNKHGIHLIVEKHLAQTYLDGAAMLSEQERPIIALTLRYDRLDNFWFTLCHELAHIRLHLKRDCGIDAYFDDLDYPSKDLPEKEANQWASSVLLDPKKWSRADFNVKSAPNDIVDWSNKERISPAIPAGRIRKESRNYRVFSRLVGSKKVRRCFPSSGW